jgi:hypothetical protein
MSLTPFDVDPAGPLIDPSIEIVDHRNLDSWDAVGARAARQHLSALHDVARDAAVRNEDILALEPTALVVRRLHSGTERVGGGIYERQYHILGGLGPDGRLNRVEFFDVGDEARALAHFDRLTADSADRQGRRRNRPRVAPSEPTRQRASSRASSAPSLRATRRRWRACSPRISSSSTGRRVPATGRASS